MGNKTIPCPGECGHSDEEHVAFDSGVAAGEGGESEATCPYPMSDGAGSDFKLAWLSGWDAGQSSLLGEFPEGAK